MVQAHKAQVEVCIGPLHGVKAGARGYAACAHDESWLASADRFEISPDLPLQEGQPTQRAQNTAAPCSHHALADTEPGAWGRRIVARTHAKAHRASPRLPALNANDADHLHKLGFLYVGRDEWRLAPAFDINPSPDQDRESKTWLSKASGPIYSIALLLDQAAYFHLSRAQALMVLRGVAAAVHGWRVLATSPVMGLCKKELDDFAPAFEHPSMQAARALVNG